MFVLELMIPLLTISKKEFDTFNREETKSHGDDELNTPPLFRRKNKGEGRAHDC